MLALIIIADILLIIIIALCLSVTISVYYGETLRVVIKYAGITIFSLLPKNEQKPQKKKKKKNKEKAKKNAEDTAKEETPEEKSESDTDGTSDETAEENAEDGKKSKKVKKAKKDKMELSEMIELIKMFLESAGKPIRRLFKKIRVTDVILNVTAAGEDAAKAAICYGRINWITHSVLGFLYEFVTLKVKQINIGADFLAEEIKAETSFKVKLRVGTAIGCVLWLAFRLIKNYLKLKKEIQSRA